MISAGSPGGGQYFPNITQALFWLLTAGRILGAVHILGLIVTRSGFWTWMLRLGAPGLILVGLIDNSVIPIPGGMDFFVILLTAGHREWWIVYAVMATAGALLGGYITYRLAKKGGKAGLEKEIGKRRAEKVYRRFEKGGFSTVLVSAMLPPPFPMVPVLMAAGVLQFPRRKFLSALGAGRLIRFLALALLGRFYGTAILGWFSRYYKPFLYGLIGAAVLGAIAAVVYFKWFRPKHKEEGSTPQQDPNTVAR